MSGENSILPGGCLPKLPRCWPPLPPADPDSLNDKVNWMTYSHDEMYGMVNSGVDLAGANSVAAEWARLGTELEEIGDDLTDVLRTLHHAWSGQAADRAREHFFALADWCGRTGESAKDVANCVTVEADNAQDARNSMPKPIRDSPFPPTIPPQTATTEAASGGTSPSSAMVNGGIATGDMLIVDPGPQSREQREAHKQAAEVMQRFQSNSREVYGTVPQFHKPGLIDRYGPQPQPPEQPKPTPPPNPGPVPPPLPGPGPTRGPSGGGSPVPGGSPAPGQPGRPAPGGVPSGPHVGAAAPEPEAARPAAAAAGQPGRPGGAGQQGMGGMPMGGASGGRGGDDIEHKSAYVAEDADLFGPPPPVAPPVIGEDHKRA
ncbi:PPE family protein [Herbihabitans rhizosphaerae]|uniref:PPE family protein n=1 Tax=Herbihabitans rhizosphaerae TaxID=1872711 RepID=A0A4Q7L830_9PSEU|nr:PPE domain-containing protein [Herbihabitans rhizosphaerae]RZS45070.1 PPE family protein [Herbihabitans rhizosphaerae]